MSQPVPYHSYTYREYLALEAASNVKHEFYNGEIYAMAGGTPEHAALTLAIGAALLAQLRGGSCRVFSSDLRVRVLATGLTAYPDVSVAGGQLRRDPASDSTVTNPRLLVAVLSDGTAAFDRGEKLEQYKRIESVQASRAHPRAKEVSCCSLKPLVVPSCKSARATVGEPRS